MNRCWQVYVASCVLFSSADTVFFPPPFYYYLPPPRRPYYYYIVMLLFLATSDKTYKTYHNTITWLIFFVECGSHHIVAHSLHIKYLFVSKGSFLSVGTSYIQVRLYLHHKKGHTPDTLPLALLPTPSFSLELIH